MYPLGENTFGIRSEMLEISFGDGCVIVEGKTFGKL